MLPRPLIFLSVLLSAALAAPQRAPAEVDIEADWTTTSTVAATVTFNITRTLVTTLPEVTTTTSTTSSSSYKTIYTATQVYAFKPDSPIHLLPIQAKGSIFRLGDSPGIYCPSFVEEEGGCSMDSNVTGINGCSLVSNWSHWTRSVPTDHVPVCYRPRRPSHLPSPRRSASVYTSSLSSTVSS